jgi:hypothetical protein
METIIVHNKGEYFMANHETPPSTPRWVKIFGIIAIVLILLFVILKLTGIGGNHGPSRHFSFNELNQFIQPVEQRIQEL